MGFLFREQKHYVYFSTEIFLIILKYVCNIFNVIQVNESADVFLSLSGGDGGR